MTFDSLKKLSVKTANFKLKNSLKHKNDVRIKPSLKLILK